MAENVTVEFVSNIIDISRKRAIIRNPGALFGKEKIEKLGFFLKISYRTIFVKQWGCINCVEPCINLGKVLTISDRIS